MQDRNQAARRAAPRSKLFEPAEMVLGIVRSRVHLLDLSLTGARIHARADVDVDSEIMLWCDGPLGVARVIWRRGPRFGVMFARPLAQRRLDALLSAQDRQCQAFRDRSLESV